MLVYKFNQRRDVEQPDDRLAVAIKSKVKTEPVKGLKDRAINSIGVTSMILTAEIKSEK